MIVILFQKLKLTTKYACPTGGGGGGGGSGGGSGGGLSAGSIMLILCVIKMMYSYMLCNDEV